MDTNTYGGVTAKDIIVFQTKIMMGAQFGRIVWARDHKSEPLGNRQNEILVVCLRIGWNDAFRHTSENEEGIKGAISTYEKKEKKEKYKKRLIKVYRGKLEEKDFSADFDDYFSEIVRKLLDVFCEYAKASTYKHLIIDSHWAEIEACFRDVKKLDGDKKLSFGHIQKMFNIAIKLYLCLFVCREELDLDDNIFVADIVKNFANADCPLDSIILGKLEQVEMQKIGIGATYTTKYDGYTWSQLNPSDYSDIQDSIKNESGGNSNLWFDFDNWN